MRKLLLATALSLLSLLLVSVLWREHVRSRKMFPLRPKGNSTARYSIPVWKIPK